MKYIECFVKQKNVIHTRRRSYSSREHATRKRPKTHVNVIGITHVFKVFYFFGETRGIRITRIVNNVISSIASGSRSRVLVFGLFKRVSHAGTLNVRFSPNQLSNAHYAIRVPSDLSQKCIGNNSYFIISSAANTPRCDV